MDREAWWATNHGVAAEQLPAHLPDTRQLSPATLARS